MAESWRKLVGRGTMVSESLIWTKIDGYKENKCLLTNAAIEALVKVQQKLRTFDLGNDPKNLVFTGVVFYDTTEPMIWDHSKHIKFLIAIDQWKLSIILLVGRRI